MSALTTAISPDGCLDCGAPLADRDVAGEALSECTSCGSLRVGRGALNRLRGQSPEADPLLAASPNDPPAHTVPKTASVRKCPVCQAVLLSHPFGGGNVRVETCESCELVYLRRGRLGAIVKEARDGFDMSDDARAMLHQHRLMAAGNRFSAAEFGMGTAALAAVLFFLRWVLRTGFSTTAMVGAGVLAGGFLVYRQRQLRGQRDDAAQKMDRLTQEELARLEQRKEPEPRALAPKPAVAALPPAAEDSVSRPSDSQKSAAKSRHRGCPVCRAPLPAGTTHCKACDSDFG